MPFTYYSNSITANTTATTAPFYIYTGPSLTELLRRDNPEPAAHNPERWVNPYHWVRINRDNESKYHRQHIYDWTDEWRILEQIQGALMEMWRLNYHCEANNITTEDEYRKQVATNPIYSGRYKHTRLQDVAQHFWHGALQRKYKLHPAIKDAVRITPPADRHLLILEWPHVSETDPNRLAYTRDERGGREDRQVITTIGKYIKRHFPKLTDTQIRDITMRHGAFTFEMWDTTDKIISSVQDGPQSCMKWSEYDLDDNNCIHPYNVYAPEFGWRAAVRLDGAKKIVGRCLVNVDEGDRKLPPIFVRSYAHKVDGYSHSDEALEVWLRDQGFMKADNWNGRKLKKIMRGRHLDDFLAPYLDGNDKRVADCGDYLLVTEDGEYQFERTDGHHDRCGSQCSHCDEYVDDDDLTSVGYHGDASVCQGCLDYHYTYVYGRRGNQYYIHSDEAMHCPYDDEYYDPDYLSDNNMVELSNGDVCPLDDAVYLESRDEYVHCEDECVIYCDRDDKYEHIDDCVRLEDGSYAHEENAWLCDITGNYYHEDDDDKKVEFCEIETKACMCGHSENVEDTYSVDLDNAFDVCADMTLA